MTCFRDRKHTSYNESDNVSMTKALASSSDNSNKIYKHVYTLMLKKTLGLYGLIKYVQTNFFNTGVRL